MRREARSERSRARTSAIVQINCMVVGRVLPVRSGGSSRFQLWWRGGADGSVLREAARLPGLKSLIAANIVDTYDL